MVLSRLFRRRHGANGVKEKIEYFLDYLLVALVRGCFEEIAMTAPHPVHEQDRPEHTGHHGRVDVAELPIADAALDDAADETQFALDDLASVEAREIGEIAQLSMNEAEERRELRRAEKVPIAAHEVGEGVGRGLLRRSGEVALGALDLGDDGVTDDLAKELFLVGEVEIDGAFREAGSFGDIVEPRGSEAAFAEDGERRVDDLLRSLLGESPPAWFLSRRDRHRPIFVTDQSVSRLEVARGDSLGREAPGRH